MSYLAEPRDGEEAFNFWTARELMEKCIDPNTTEREKHYIS